MGRHESFDNATPLTDELLSGTILGSLHLQDPILAAIERHKDAYATWDRAWLHYGGMLATDPAFQVAKDAFDATARDEDAAFDNLLSARPATLSGLQALADYLPGACNLRDSEQAESDPVRALEALRDSLSQIQAEPGGKPMEAGGELDPRCYADQADLSHEPMHILRSLSDIASTISEVAAAITCQPRCETETGYSLNTAGQFAEWIKESSHWMLDKIRDEARSRSPETRSDRETRLQILARSTVDNGDPQEMFALAREMAAEAACHG